MKRIALLTLLLAAAVAAAADSGWFGFWLDGVEDEGSHTLDPTILSMRVFKVITPSPAASAGLLPNDGVVEIEGIKAAGAKADSLFGAMQKAPGQTLHLKIRRAGADVRDVSLVAVTKPADQP